MSEMYAILMEIKEDIGALRASSESTNRLLAQHVIDDKELAADVKALELRAAKQKGEARVWGLVYGAGGAILGALGSTFLSEVWKHH